MGIFTSRLFAPKPVRILMVGLDAAGKTTILHKLRLGEVVQTVPTIGFNVESVEHENFTFTCWDVGGGDKIRPLWRSYYGYSGCTCMIFVVDCNDHERIDYVDKSNSARAQLAQMLAEETLHCSTLLVLANKQDLPGALPAPVVAARLGLPDLHGLNWHIQPCSALTGDGLPAAFAWLSAALHAHSPGTPALPLPDAIPPSSDVDRTDSSSL